MPEQFRWFLAGQGFWFAAFGLQAVMFPYLVVSVLHETPENVGIAQLCLMAPSIALMIPGGMLADSKDLRALLMQLQLWAVLPAGILALVTNAGALSFTALIVFALLQGSLQALIMPTRDALLGRVAGSNIQRAVTTAMTIQFCAQIIGFVLAGNAATIGIEWLLGVQVCLYGCGALCARKMAPLRPVKRIEPFGHDSVSCGNRSLSTAANAPDAGGASKSSETLATEPSAWSELKVAFWLVAHSPRMAPVTLLMVGVGFCYIGVFSVVVPVMVRDIYAGGSAAQALVNGTFVTGVLSATLALRACRTIDYQGRAIFLAASLGALIITLFALYPPMWGFYLLIFIFGNGAGVVMSLGRTLVQEAASPAHRARILAIYSVAFLGAAPVGAYVVGQVAQKYSLAVAAVSAAVLMCGLLTMILWKSQVWYVGRDH